VIYQVKKKKSQVLVLLWGGVNFSRQTHAVRLGFVEKKILRIGRDGKNFGLGSASTAV
jgi:hypothetical protein